MSRNTRIGLILFFIYFALYGAYVVLNAFSPQVMELTPIRGVTLAIIYGFGLIIVAFALAMLYGLLCMTSKNEGESP